MERKSMPSGHFASGVIYKSFHVEPVPNSAGDLDMSLTKFG
jgi:hypothetical protein